MSTVRCYDSYCLAGGSYLDQKGDQRVLLNVSQDEGMSWSIVDFLESPVH